IWPVKLMCELCVLCCRVQDLDRLLQLDIFAYHRLRRRCWRRSDWLTRIRWSRLVKQRIDILRILCIAAFYLDAWLDAERVTVIAKERYARRRGPLCNGQEQSAASGKREEFLVRTRTECPLADDRSALVIGKCRNDRFGGSGCIDIRDDSRFALKDDLRRVGGICLRDLIVFSDLGRQCAVADKEICDLYAFFEAAAGNRTKVKYDLLHSLLGKRTDRLADLVRIAFVERKHLYDAGLPGFDLCFRSRRLRIAA